jgi:hypothetical protein
LKRSGSAPGSLEYVRQAETKLQYARAAKALLRTGKSGVVQRFRAAWSGRTHCLSLVIGFIAAPAC